MASRVSLIYAVTALGWTVLSVFVLDWFDVNGIRLMAAATAAAVVFVLVTSAILFLTLRRLLGGVFTDRRSLERSEQSLRTLVESLADPLFLTDDQGQFLEVNPRACESLGRSREELLNMRVSDIDAGMAWDHISELMSESAQNPRHIYTLETRHRRADGSTFPVEVRALPVEWQGRLRFLSMTRDLSDRKRVEAELRSTAERYRLATTSGRVVTWEADENAVLRRIDPTFWEWVEAGPNGAPSDLESWIAWHHPDDREHVYEAVRSAYEGRSEEIAFEFRARLVGGETGWFQCRGRVARDTEGTPLGATGSVMDITPRKHAELRRRECDERYRLALDGAGLGAWDLNLLSGDANYDERWGQLLRYRPEELVPHIRLWEGFLHADDEREVHAALQDHLDGRTDIFTAEHRLRRKNGTWAWVVSTGKVIERDVDGRPVRMCGVVQDISPQKAEEEARRETERLARSVLDSLQTSVAVLDETGTILEVNSSWREFASENGAPEGAFLGANYLNVCDTATGAGAEQATALAAGVRDVLAGTRSHFEIEYPCVSPSACRWFVGRVTPFAEGGPRRVVVAHTDVTSHKTAEVALRESEERLRLALDSAKASAWEWDPRTDENVWPDELWEFVGIENSPGQSSYETWLASVHPEDRDRADRAARGAFAGGLDYSAEWRVHEPGGAVRWLMARGKPVCDEAGRITRYIGIVLDITERKQAEEALAQTRNTLAEAQKIAHLGCFEYLAATRTTVWSEEEFRIYGLDPAGPSPTYHEMLSKLIHPDDAGLLHETFMRAIRDRTEYELEHRIVRGDGVVRWVHDLARPFFDEQGELVRYVGTTLDVTDRKRAEVMLRQQLDLQGQLAKVAEAVPGAIYTFHVRPDGTSHMPYASPAFEELTGLPRSLLAEDMAPCFAKFHPEDLPRVKESVAAAVRTLSSWHEEFRYLHPTLGERWVEGWSSPRTESDGRVLFHGYLADITERKRVERALRESEATLKAVVAGAIDAIIMTDAGGTVLSFNPAAERIFGHAAGEAVGRNVSLLMPPPQHERHDGNPNWFLRAEDRPVIDVGREITGMRKDGTVFPMEIGVSEIQVGGKVVFVGILRDATDRKRAEEAIRTLNTELERRVAERTADVHRLAQIIDSTTDFIGTATPEGRSYWRNAAYRRALGEDLEGACRRHQISEVHPADALRKIFTEGIPAAVRDGHWEGETAVLAGGRVIPVSQLILAHRDDDGRVAFLSTIMRDITERKSLEQDLQERSAELATANAGLARANRLKDEFLASMSHELRTPLNAVLGLSQALVEGTYGAVTAQQARVIRDVERSGRHLLGLINDILDLSKIEAGELKLNPSRMSVTAVCQAGLRMVRQAAQGKRIQLTMTADEMVGPIVADELRLKQILVNLLSNAVKFTPEGGEVALDARGDRAAGTITFAVQDTGIGIRAEDTGILFQPFRQIDSRLSRQYAGTGLGLALVRKLAVLHGGSVSVESELGRGSRFSITIPWVCGTDEAIPAADALEPGLAADQPSSGGIPADARATGRDAAGEAPLVLVAEDDELAGSMTASVLEAAGYRVARARDGSEALSLTKELAPRIVLMDIQMPGTHGLEVIRLLRSRAETREIPVVALTLAMVGDRERCLEAEPTPT
ncbi:MAG: PAS domain S-box protein [Isosphaeraceae bacterium]